LAELKLELVRVQLDLLKGGSERTLETYERKTKQKDEGEAKLRFDILKIELKTKPRVVDNLPSTPPS
jgi:hypothetical protein